MAEELTQDDLTKLRLEAQAALLRAVAQRANEGHSPHALMAAEAYAWLNNPAQPHGGGSAKS